MQGFFRVIKFSLQDIVRNGWLSIATITILLLALLSVNVLLTVQTVSDSAINAVKKKIDVSLYMKSDASEDQILELKTQILSLPEVSSVKYISKDMALASFREKYTNNPEILQALKELGRNPLSPSLVIMPTDTAHSQVLISELQQLSSDIIESRDFSDNSLILEKIDYVTKRINEIGWFLIAIFMFTSLLVAYNTIRVTIYTHKREIEIMRLVGASNYFIYMPYFISAFVYALIAVLITICLFFPFLTVLQPYLEVFFNDYSVNLISFFADNFSLVFGLQFMLIFVINSMASWLAARKYSKI